MFIEDSDPIRDMHIGYIDYCRLILEKMNGIILSNDQSSEYKKICDPNAKFFLSLEFGVLTKICEASIVIEHFDDKFYIFKNMYFTNTRNFTGKIENLYDVIMYWQNKNRKIRKKRKWRTLETGERIYV